MFSIIIPSLNNLNYLKICIKSLKKNSFFNHQIIVHLNVGTDGSEDFLKLENIEYTLSDENLGLCKAVNLAAKKSRYNYILYSHDDFYYCPNWDQNIVNEIKKIGHNKFYLSSTHVNMHNIEEFNCGVNYSSFNEDKLLMNYDKINFPDVQGSTWAPHLVHKSYWDKVNGFSEEFFPGVGSDPDFNLKLWKAGIRIFKMLGNSKVYHFESKTLRNKEKFKFFKNFEIGSRSSKIFLKKWGISIKFFRKFFLRSETLYKSELKEPKKNFIFICSLFICKLNYLYLKIFN
jgi:GT2 family glycosyltransferase